MTAVRSPTLHRYADPETGRWTGIVDTLPQHLGQPARWQGSQWAFVGSQTDLFHDRIPTAFLEAALDVMIEHRQHRYGLLTKRAERMRRFFRGRTVPDNVMIGVTVEDPDNLDRADILLEIEARTRWVSAEPLLAPIDFGDRLGPDQINWMVAGPELGLEARPCDVAWLRSLIEQCARADIPFFTKHLIDDQAHRAYPV